MPNAQKLWQAFMDSAEKRGANSRAVRRFIGRDELLKLYFGLKDRAREERFEGCYVVNFYGEPGIGKSALLRQIESRLQAEATAAKKKPPVILRADFDNPALSSVQDVLGLFRTQLLSQVKGAAFPFFDMAIHLLAQKQGRRLLPDEEKASMMDNPVLSFAFHMRSAEAWYALAFHMWETHRDALPFSRQCTFLKDWGGVCDELQRLMMLNESEKRRFAQSGEKAWTLMLELCENEQSTQDKTTPDFCRAQYELGQHYWHLLEWEPCISHFRQAAQGYRELGKAWSTYAMTAEGALHAARDLANNLKAPGADGFDWEYTWTGTETAEDLELLQDWAYFRISSCNCNIDGYYSLVRKIAGAYRALDAKPSRSALAAEVQTIVLYVQQQLDPRLVAKCALWDLENPGPDGKEWDWDTPLFRDYNTGAETAKTCMELVERAKRVLSPADPLIADALDALAQAQEGQCLYHLAIPVRQEALALYLAAYGPDAVNTLNQEEKLIDAYRKAKKLEDAIRLQQRRLAYARETMDARHQEKELIRTADLYRRLLCAADGPEQIRECFSGLNGILEELRAMPGTVSEESAVPWGRAAIWCLNHAEKDVEPDTGRFVSAVVDLCKDISHTVFTVKDGRTVAQVILEGMEEESGWRYDLWEEYWPDDEGAWRRCETREHRSETARVRGRFLPYRLNILRAGADHPPHPDRVPCGPPWENTIAARQLKKF